MTKDNKHERWQWISDTLADALQIEDCDARAAFVRARCGADEAAAREILSLLEADTSASQTLDPTMINASARALLVGASARSSDLALASHWHGKRLGAYEIIDTIAVGGMGAVYKARRADHVYETLVAIKVMREDLGVRAARSVLARFQAERQMLASLNHPNITRLIDGGSTDDGLPYFVMEYVDGVAIDRYCENNALPIAERLAKFRDVLSAVHFAHQRLIVHRDLKPSNILVDNHGVVKLLDFGIARLLDPEIHTSSSERTPHTTMLALTPAYASPEQVKSEAITTASDVYSLGVVLYRLLTGVSPYKSKTTEPMALAREIAETDPERPSSAAVTATKHSDNGTTRTIDVTRLKKTLRGDLDNIVLMALRKDPARRYASAEQFGEDIRRYLAHEPVVAHADSLAYRANKFIRRNRWSVAFASLAAIGLVGGIIATAYQAKLAREAQARAERLFGNVRDLSNRFVNEVFEQIHPVPGTSVAQQTVIATATEYLDKLATDAIDNRRLLLEAAQGHLKLAQMEERALLPAEKRAATLGRGISLLERAERLGARDHPSLALLLHLQSILGELEITQGKHASALARFEQLAPFAQANEGDSFPLLRAKGDFLLAFGTSARALGQSQARAIKLIDSAQRSYVMASGIATEAQERFAVRMLIALTSLQAGRIEADLPAGAGLKRAISRLEPGYAQLVDLLRERPKDSALVANSVLSSSLLADYWAKLGDFTRSREYFRLALQHDDARVSDSGLRLGDVNSLVLRLTQIEVEMLAGAKPNELATLLAAIDQRIEKFPTQSVDELVANAIAAWREGLAGEVFLRQGNEVARLKGERISLVTQSVAAFARFDALIKKVPKEYFDQNRPEILALVTTGTVRARAALEALRN